MKPNQFPTLDAEAIAPTRDALHAYARILEAWMTKCRLRRKHWWHASLRPSLSGLTTGVVYSGIEFELELDFRASKLFARTSRSEEFSESLEGQSAMQVATRVGEFLKTVGLDEQPDLSVVESSARELPGYSSKHAHTMARAISSVAAALEVFRAGIREESSPIQLWPHHFDLAMQWLPGDKVAGQDPANEEESDKQMNFGFTFGDEGIPEPYFYVTAYPEPPELSHSVLPEGTVWQTQGFSGAVLRYQSLIEQSNPHEYLVGLWKSLLSAGSEHMRTAKN